jgi:hypothetical protein
VAHGPHDASVSFEEACFLAGISDDVLKDWLVEKRVASRLDAGGKLQICLSSLAKTALEDMKRREAERQS